MQHRHLLISIILFMFALAAAAHWSLIPLPWGWGAHQVSDPQRDAVQKEANDIVAEVGTLIQLPDGETPTIATVSDPSKLVSQAFFAHAQTGDKVLLYTKARKAYLYRPSQRKLIEVAPITTSTNTL